MTTQEMLTTVSLALGIIAILGMAYTVGTVRSEVKTKLKELWDNRRVPETLITELRLMLVVLQSQHKILWQAYHEFGQGSAKRKGWISEASPLKLSASIRERFRPAIDKVQDAYFKQGKVLSITDTVVFLEAHFKDLITETFNQIEPPPEFGETTFIFVTACHEMDDRIKDQLTRAESPIGQKE